MKKSILAAISIIYMFSAFGQGKNGFVVQTKIENGTVEGLYDTKSNVQMYFGIPFAKPPVGDLRWKAPQPIDNWTGVFQAKEFAPRPVQQLIWDDMHSRSNGVSEDCLYLNVWTPAKRNTTGLPVLVYFYGGGFVAGDASEPRYDGESMAKKGIVVVTVNYRLNIFGFFAHPELSKESPYKASGNYGLLDQNAGLNWVVKNIAAFGGDPKKITIAGESAGSISVSAHMVSPLSRNLIRGAIGESGAAINPTLYPIPLAEAENTGLEFARKAGYPTLAQLRALSTRDLYELYQESGRFGFPTVIDNYFYTKNLVETYKAKEHAQIPLLLGWNSAEGGAGGLMQPPYTKENYEKKVKEMYPKDYAEVLRLYTGNSEREIELAATAISSDRFISYSTWKWFDLHRKNTTQPVYRYLYSKLRPNLIGEDPAKAALAIGAPHACEIEYCMGNLHRIKTYSWTKDDYKVSETMLSYFANFIISGNPNVDKLPQWPAATKDDTTPAVMVIDVESKAVDAQNDDRYLFLDKYYKNN